ncbi:hypothetical protein [Acinetobacter sp.]|uniref:hypothetical protein n=1 Tax=Acinetobacter sp. TaxID=472 RepID=UPI00388F2AE5
MAIYSIMIDFTVNAKDQEAAEATAKSIIEAAKLEDLIKAGDVQDIEMLDDEEVQDIDFNEDDE